MEMLWLKAAHFYCWVNALIYSSTFVRQFTSVNKQNETIMFGCFIYSNNASLLSTLFKLMKASIQLSYCPRKIIEIVGMNFEGMKCFFYWSYSIESFNTPTPHQWRSQDF